MLTVIRFLVVYVKFRVVVGVLSRTSLDREGETQTLSAEHDLWDNEGEFFV